MKLHDTFRYDTKLIDKVIMTINDYFGDIEGYVLDTYFRKLVYQCPLWY